MDTLSARLEAIVRGVGQCGCAADIGSDHGLVPQALLERNCARRTIAIELKPGPLAHARRTLTPWLGDRADVRLGDGLAPLHPGEADVLVIAGMGGPTLVNILLRGATIAKSVRRLVLSPHTSPAAVRVWLLTHGYGLAHEELVLDEGHYYPVLVAIPAGDDGPAATQGLRPAASAAALAAELSGRLQWAGAGKIPVDLALELGPLVLLSRHPLLPDLVAQEVAEARTIRAALNTARSPAARSKAQRIAGRLAALEMVWEWLSQSRP